MLDPFRPFPLMANPHVQTWVGSWISLARAPVSETVYVSLDDGDQLALEVNTPAGWGPADGTVVMVHGLTGSHKSPCMVRMAGKLIRRGVRAVRVNMRGAGSGAGLARRPYYGGCSADVEAVLRHLQAAAPGPTALVGFSLGGNIVLKLAADLGARAPELLQQVLAVCPPADLQSCWEQMAQRRNRVYHRLFVTWLKYDVAARERRFPELGRTRFPSRLSMYQFDDMYTAPHWGFAGADDYYAQASAAAVVDKITIPCRVLFALDDPLIDSTTLDGATTVQVHKVPHGGHLGFIGHPTSGVQWLDPQLLRWLDAVSDAS